MIKKVINNKPPRLTSPRPNKNMFFSPLQGHNKNSSRKFKQQTPKNFNIKQNNISTSNYTNNKGLISNINDYSQSFMRLASDLIKDNNSNNNNNNNPGKNITTIESLNDLIMNSDNEESNNENGKKMISLTKMRKKDSLCKKMNLSISATHSTSITPGKKINISKISNSNQIALLPIVKLQNELNAENNKWFNLLRKSEYYEEFDFKLQNYNKIKELIAKEIYLLSRKTIISNNYNNNNNRNHIININIKDTTFQTHKHITPMNNSSLTPLMLKNTNTITHIKPLFNDYPNYFSERPAQTVIKFASNNSITNSRKYVYSLPDRYYNSRNTNNNSRKVNNITSEIYLGIFNKIFNEICVMPNYIDRCYIKFHNLSYMNLCFLKPFLDVLFKCLLSINKGEFLRFCEVIYKELTTEEKKKFIYENKMQKGKMAGLY